MTRLSWKTTHGPTETEPPREPIVKAAGHDGTDGADRDAPAPTGTEAEPTRPTEPTGLADPGVQHSDPDVQDANPGCDPSPDPSPDLGSRIGGRWRTAALAAAVTLLLAGGGAFLYGAHQLRSAASAQNRALTDTATTERINGQVGDGLARIFSYTPTGADATARSARTVLGGKAARQYDDLFGRLRANLETQKITLNTQVVRTGVIELHGDTARLLVLLDQTSRRDGGATTSAAAQLTVTARHLDDRWQIVDIKAR
ncbi:hypothetical protein ACIRP0_23240 [Streptomyces sp. NPDC101733]|uniref:hypothetical protein n=1 Tax=unclassified Streptomyces TaxID=2593676 RepID=UPI003828B2EA